jgi:RNA polymerase sigma-70 factor (ECF subfamily)
VEAQRAILTGDIVSDWIVGVAQPEKPLAGAGRLDDADEPALVAACLQGRRDAFDVLVRRHQRAVYRLCYRFVNNHEDAADLAQEVFLRAYRGLRSFRGGSTFGTWLHRIAVNASLNRVAVKSPPMEALDGAAQFAERSRDPAAGLIREETAARVRAAVARLPGKQRATLILRVYRDMSHQEIASVLGTSVGAVKANFFHALTNLKKTLSASREVDHEPPVAR